FPALLHDMGTPWGIRRLHNMVVYGETPHNFALSILPIALLLIKRCLDNPSRRKFAAAALVGAAVAVSNAFGIVVLGICSAILVLTRRERTLTSLLLAAGILVCAYLSICRALTPSLVHLISTNSQMVGGYYNFTANWFAAVILFLGIIAGLWFALHRRA